MPPSAKPFRCCIHKDRDIVKCRIISVLGFSLENEFEIYNNQAHIEPIQCINCGKCMKVCPFHAIIYVPVPCEEACPVGAIYKYERGKENIDYSKCISRAPVSLSKLVYESFKGRVIYHTKYNDYFKKNVKVQEVIFFTCHLTGILSFPIIRSKEIDLWIEKQYLFIYNGQENNGII